MEKYGVKHKVATTYHPQSNAQFELSNRKIQRILEKMVNPSRKDWFKHLDDALWAYKTGYKTSLGLYLHRLVYVKSCHSPIEL